MIAVDLNPHQFGDQGVLFDAPLGQESTGVFKGNQHARLYRSLQIPEWHAEKPQDVADFVAQPRSDRGHETHLGIHWQHDLDVASDLAVTSNSNDWGRHGDHGVSVILEADHPGYEHVVDFTPEPGGGPPEGMKPRAFRSGALTGRQRDWALTNDTIGAHDLLDFMLPEVPVRPGAPMRVHAIHMENPHKAGEYIRHPLQFKGQA